jgi:hypothetical protein
MKRFTGIILLMGQVKTDHIKEYWSTNSVTESLVFSKLISRGRFKQILQYWYVNDNKTVQDNSGILFKIKPILDYLLTKSETVYKPNKT